MSLTLRIPGTRSESHVHRHHEHNESEDSLDRLPGQMMNLAGTAIIGSMALGFMGAMFKK